MTKLTCLLWKSSVPKDTHPRPWGRGAAACIQVCLERAKGKMKVSSIHAESMETRQRRKGFFFCCHYVAAWVVSEEERRYFQTEWQCVNLDNKGNKRCKWLSFEILCESCCTQMCSLQVTSVLRRLRLKADLKHVPNPLAGTEKGSGDMQREGNVISNNLITWWVHLSGWSTTLDLTV